MNAKNPNARIRQKDARRNRNGNQIRTEANSRDDTLTIGPADRLTHRRFRADQRRLLDPRDPHESALADAIVAQRWFLRLADLAEIAALREALRRDESPPLTWADAFSPEAADLKSALAQCNAPQADAPDRWLAVAFERADLDKIHKFRKEHERALDRLTKEWALLRRSNPESRPEAPT